MKDDEYFLSFIKKSPEISEKTKNIYLRYIDNIQKEIWPRCHSKHKCDDNKCCLAYILKHPQAFTDKLNDYCDNTKGRQGEKLGNQIPLVITLNKRDVPNAMSRNVIIETLNLDGYPTYETVATTGVGVKRAFQSLAREIIMMHVYRLKEAET